MRDDMQVLSVGKIANLCHVGRATVQRWVSQGKIKSFSLPSGHSRVKVDDFISFLNEFDMPVPDELYNSFKRILLVDDDKSVLKSIEEMISDIPSLNVKIEKADGGIQGCLKLGSFSPHVLILDLNMPDVGGLDVAKELHNSSQKTDTQVIVITGFADEQALSHLKSIGVERILLKPFNVDDLQNHIKECLV